MRNHDVTVLTGRELEQARRELVATLALARPTSPRADPGADDGHRRRADKSVRRIPRDGPERPVR
jgi:hypothetical protein